MSKKFLELSLEDVYGKNKNELLEILGIDKEEWDMMDELEQLNKLEIPLNQWIKLPDHLYHNPLTPGLSSSGMKTIVSKTPKFYKYYKDNPKWESKDNLVFGSAFHCYILEPENFDKNFLVIEDGIRKNSAAWKKYFQDANGREIIKQSTFESILGMAESLSNYFNLLEVLRQGKNEYALFAYDEEFGVLLRTKVDSILDDKVIDLKTTTNANPKEFTKAITQYGYDLQSWLYLRICEIAGFKKQMFGFVAVEKTAPFLVNGIVINPEDVDYYSSKVASEALKKYSYCVTTGDWYGYEMDEDNRVKKAFHIVSMPNWYKYEIEEKAEFQG